MTAGNDSNAVQASQIHIDVDVESLLPLMRS